jgi:hypothetical protein
MNQTSDITTTGINWRLGTFRLWIIVSGLWSAVVFSVMLTNRNLWVPFELSRDGSCEHFGRRNMGLPH